MSQLVVQHKSVVDLDGFNDFTSEAEGDDSLNAAPRAIQGTKIKFIDPRWLIEERDVTGTLLTVLGVRKVVNKWSKDSKPLVTNILAPNEKFPDFKKLNAETPRSEWRVSFGEEVGPWSGQHCLYFIDENYNCYTWPSPLRTIGSCIAVEEIVDQIKRVRKVKRDDNLYPVSELGHTYFRTGYGDRERPYLLKIQEWVKLGPDRADSVTLPAPDTPVLSGAGSVRMQGAPADAQTVELSLKEELDDEIPH